MNNLFDIINKFSIFNVIFPQPETGEPGSGRITSDYSQYLSDLAFIAGTHSRKLSETALMNRDLNADRLTNVVAALDEGSTGQHWYDYWNDAAQRYVLFLGALHRRSKFFLEHEQGGEETVLSWEHTTIIDGTTLARPVNYSLVRIKPPEGIKVRENGRPYIIIDPRAGHGSGIGGFKDESQVGAAIHQGHPTYFVTFTRMPVPGQTIADITAAEVHFVHEVRKLHPDAPKPVIIGNCQGGWATMLLAATSADITGPIVVNGAPLSYWAGQKGKNPMRYFGGLTGGAGSVRMMSDLGNGLFDGSNLVLNFERLNPGETWWNKYYNLWDKIDSEVDRFVGFERWWGTFYYMNTNEISWILENLFIGNRLARGSANLNERKHIDLREINSPIIVFASHGDNITPPQQALGWIRDNYKDVEEIKTYGQRILYTLHKDAGHLGIFVSSSVARKEHQQFVSTLKAIEALHPGLYELVITENQGKGVEKKFTVSFANRTIEQMMEQTGGDDSNEPFAAVARFSELGAELYDLTLSPLIKAMSNETSAAMMAHFGPMRLFRWLESDLNPFMWPVETLAEEVRNNRREAPSDNPFRTLERFTAGLIHQWWNGVRDMQEAIIEWNFHAFWGLPFARSLGKNLSRTVSEAPQEDLRTLASVQDALDRISIGGYAEGVLRMLILLAQSRKEVRRSRLERSNEMMMTNEPFKSMTPKQLSRMIHRQSLIVSFEPDEAITTLPELLQTKEDREQAMKLCELIAGPREEMSVETIDMFERLARSLEINNQNKK